MRISVSVVCLIILTAPLSGCLEEERGGTGINVYDDVIVPICDKIFAVDNQYGEIDDIFLHIIQKSAEATGQYQVVAAIKLLDGITTFCAGVECIEDSNVDACIELADFFIDNQKTEMVVFCAYKYYQAGHEANSTSEFEEVLTSESGGSGVYHSTWGDHSSHISNIVIFDNGTIEAYWSSVF